MKSARVYAGGLIMFGMQVAIPSLSADEAQVDVDIVVAVDSAKVVDHSPIIAHVTLTNIGETPIPVNVCKDGLPYALAVMIAPGGEPFARHDQWLTRPGPEFAELMLEPLEQTTGDLLIWTTGILFSNIGDDYRLKVVWSSNVERLRFESNMIDVSVVTESEENEQLLQGLDVVACRYYGYDPTAVIHLPVDAHIAQQDILKRMFNQQAPHLVDPTRRPEDKKKAKMIEELHDLLEQYPDSSYSAYIARYLGLVHLNTLEHEYSLAGAKAWRETGKDIEWNASKFRGDPEYQQALRYLTMADNAGIWPRTCAQRNLAWLHGLAREWDKFEACCDRLRTEYADLNGAELASQLEKTMQRFKKRIQHSESVPNE